MLLDEACGEGRIAEPMVVVVGGVLSSAILIEVTLVKVLEPARGELVVPCSSPEIEVDDTPGVVRGTTVGITLTPEPIGELTVAVDEICD